MFSSVCTPGLFKQNHHLLEQIVEKISRFGGLSALDASPYKQFDTTIIAANCHTSKRFATYTDDIVLGLDQLLINELGDDVRKRQLLKCVSHKNTSPIGIAGSFLVRPS